MHRILLALALCAAVAAPAAAQILPHPATVDRLPNGLTVVTAPFDSPGIVAVYIVVRVGSRNEVEAGRTGFAHFFEHMMFRGTERFPAEQYERLVQSLGADNNANTSSDRTCYTTVLPAAALPTLIDVEADRFQNLSYSVEGFQTEAHAIHGEYLTAISDPGLKMEETLLSMAFTTHTYGHTVIGWLEDIDRMPEGYDFSLEFFHRFYTPDNTFIVVAGDVDRDALLALVTEKFGGWERRLDAPEVPAEPEQLEPRSRHVDWTGPAPRRMFAAWKAPAFSAATVDSAAIDVASELIFGETGALYRRLVVEEQKLLTLDRWGTMDRDPTLLVLDAKLAGSFSFDDAVADFQGAIDAAAAGEVDAAHVEEVKSNVRYGLPMALETPAQVAGLLAQVISATGDPLALDAYVERIGEVTPADVSRVAGTWLAAAHRNVVTLAPAPAAPAAERGAP
ncbi:MAG: insulinase family protein [Deltaproteobacteria bacterium]|nr:insulinase family protein [Deltaproteobacteria bacterium]